MGEEESRCPSLGVSVFRYFLGIGTVAARHSLALEYDQNKQGGVGHYYYIPGFASD